MLSCRLFRNTQSNEESDRNGVFSLSETESDREREKNWNHITSLPEILINSPPSHLSFTLSVSTPNTYTHTYTHTFAWIPCNMPWRPRQLPIICPRGRRQSFFLFALFAEGQPDCLPILQHLKRKEREKWVAIRKGDIVVFTLLCTLEQQIEDACKNVWAASA